MKLCTKYQRPMPSGFSKKSFEGSLYISLCKTHQPGAGPFWPQGYNLNNLGRGLLCEAMYQISKA